MLGRFFQSSAIAEFEWDENLNTYSIASKSKIFRQKILKIDDISPSYDR